MMYLGDQWVAPLALDQLVSVLQLYGLQPYSSPASARTLPCIRSTYMSRMPQKVDHVIYWWRSSSTRSSMVHAPQINPDDATRSQRSSREAPASKSPSECDSATIYRQAAAALKAGAPIHIHTRYSALQRPLLCTRARATDVQALIPTTLLSPTCT